MRRSAGRFILWLLILSSCAVADSEEHHRPLQILLISYPPYTGIGLPHGGQSVALLAKHLHNAGFVVQLRELPPARLQKRMLHSSEWAVSFMPPANQPGRVALSNMALAADDIRISLFRRRQEPTFAWQHLRELAPGSIAVTRTLTRSALGKQINDAGLAVWPVDNQQQAFGLLLRGRVDYVLAAEASGWFEVEQANAKRADYQFADSDLLRLSSNVWLNMANPQARQVRALLLKQGLTELATRPATGEPLSAPLQ